MQARRFYPGFNPAEGAASNLRQEPRFSPPTIPSKCGQNNVMTAELRRPICAVAASGGGNLHSGEAWVVRFQSFTDSTL